MQKLRGSKFSVGKGHRSKVEEVTTTSLQCWLHGLHIVLCGRHIPSACQLHQHGVYVWKYPSRLWLAGRYTRNSHHSSIQYLQHSMFGQYIPHLLVELYLSTRTIYLQGPCLCPVIPERVTPNNQSSHSQNKKYTLYRTMTKCAPQPFSSPSFAFYSHLLS